MIVVCAIERPRSAIIPTRLPRAELESQILQILPRAQDDDLVIAVPHLEWRLQTQQPGNRAALKRTA